LNMYAAPSMAAKREQLNAEQAGALVEDVSRAIG